MEKHDPQQLKLDSTSKTEVVTSPDTFSTLGNVRRIILLVVFCATQFLDAFNNSALFAAIPPIAVDLNIDNSTSVWLISAYQLTFAALLLSVRAFFLFSFELGLD